jgi:hypothetical protein
MVDQAIVRLSLKSPEWGADKIGGLVRKEKLRVANVQVRQVRCLHVERNIGSGTVKEIMMQVIQEYGSPAFIRSGNGPESIGKLLMEWFKEKAIKTL